MPIHILNRRRTKTPRAPELRARIGAILAAIGHGRAELSVALVGDAEIAALNLAWRRKQGPTDVLAFPLREGECSDVAPHMLGDVVISVDTAARQAAAAGHSLARELDILLTHGILHLAGYDHEQGPQRARQMRAEERRIARLLEGMKG